MIKQKKPKALTIDEILKKRKPSGHDVGRAYIMTLCHASNQLKDMEPAPRGAREDRADSVLLFPREEWAKLTDRLFRQDNENENQIFARYLNLNNWIMQNVMHADARFANACNIARGAGDELEAAWTAEHLRYRIRTVEAVLTAEQRAEIENTTMIELDKPPVFGWIGLDRYTSVGDSREFQNYVRTLWNPTRWEDDKHFREQREAMDWPGSHVERAIRWDLLGEMMKGLYFVTAYNIIVETVADYLSIPEIVDVFKRPTDRIEMEMGRLSYARDTVEAAIKYFAEYKEDGDTMLPEYKERMDALGYFFRGTWVPLVPREKVDKVKKLIEHELLAFNSPIPQGELYDFCRGPEGLEELNEDEEGD